ncbi:hypothetical protein JCM11491_005210 [Sporobolomyces phaffii]
MSGTSSSPSPPPYLLPGFEPAKVKVAELRGILLAHNIPYPSNAKKSDLVNLFKSQVVPLIPQLLAELSAVRASDDGVLDGDSLDGSLRELDTDPEEFAQQPDNSSRRDAAKKKKSKRKSMVGRAHEAAAAAEEQDELSENGGETASPRKKNSAKARRNEIPVEDEYPAEYDEVVPLAGEPSANASPKKRKASANISGDESTPRRASILKDRRRTIQSEGEAGFSDYNPFQSGGEDTPGRDLKRRKSSMGTDKIKERKAMAFESEPAPSSPPPPPVPSASTHTSGARTFGASSPVKPSTTSSSAATRPDLTTANSWSSSTPEEARQRLLNPDGARRATMGASATSVPSPASSKPFQDTSSKGKAKVRASIGGEGLASVPVGVKFMVPVEKVKTSPLETQRLMREYEEEQRREKARKRQQQEEVERKRREEELAKAEAEVKRLEEEEMARQLERQEADEMAVDDLEFEQGHEIEEDPLEAEEMEVEEDELAAEGDPFEGGEFEQDEFEGGEEDELFGESAPVPPPVVQALRQDRISTPRRSEPLPYSPRQALLDAQQRHAVNTSRRSFPLPTPPASASRRQIVPATSRPSKKESQAIALRPDRSTVVPRDTAQAVKRVTGWTIALLAIVYSLWWREEKLAVGFCDTNSPSNALVSQRSTSLAVPALPSSLCTTLDALNLRPTCTPCPAHGFCQDAKFVGCSIDYVPKASPLRLGGLLPVPPRCVPDTEKLMVVALQASKASRLLRRRRGEVVCGGLKRLRKKQISAPHSGAGIGDRDAFVYGLQADNVLTALMRENEASKSPFSEEVLEELNRLALNDLVNHGEVLTWQDGDEYWYASKTAEMPLSCQARLAAIRSAKKHKTGLAGIVSALLSMVWLRYKLQARIQEKNRVAELVQTALVQLQRQERSHHADPVLVPFPHIAPSHLRDLVLQHVHSPTRRAQLWRKVERVVEGNSNVRVMQVEQNGEELRGWQWVGATTTTTGGRPTREIEAAGAHSIASSAGSSPEKQERPEMFQSGRSVLNAAASR